MNEQYLKDLLVALATHLRDSCDSFLEASNDSNSSDLDLQETKEFETLSLSSQCLSYILIEIEKINESEDEIRDSLSRLSIDLDGQ